MDLDGIRQRLSAASPGPWARHGSDVFAGDAPLLRGRDGSAEIRAQADRDAEFVAHARDDISALLEAIDRLREPAESASEAESSTH